MYNTAEFHGTIRVLSVEKMGKVGNGRSPFKELVLEVRDFNGEPYYIHIRAWNRKVEKLEKYRISQRIGVRVAVKSVRPKNEWITLVNLIDVIPTDFEEYQRV